MKTLDLPKIRIKDAWLLRMNASAHIHKLYAKKDEPLADDEWMARKVKSYQKAWKPFEEKILTSICDVLDLRFNQNIINVYIAPWFFAFSEPLVIGVTRGSDEFIDTLTHELIHRLLTDSNKTPEDLTRISDEWKNLFGKNHSFNTLVHIPVHAVHKYIYLDVLKDPSRLKRDYEKDRNGPDDYIKSWDYVNRIGYRKIIKQLRENYDSL